MLLADLEILHRRKGTLRWSQKLLSWESNAGPESPGKSWEVYWLPCIQGRLHPQISWPLSWEKTSVATCGKICRLYRISSEKSWTNKSQLQWAESTKTLGREEDFISKTAELKCKVFNNYNNKITRHATKKKVWPKAREQKQWKEIVSQEAQTFILL